MTKGGWKELDDEMGETEAVHLGKKEQCPEVDGQKEMAPEGTNAPGFTSYRLGNEGAPY